MSMLATIDSLPRIVISKADEKRLTAIATAASQRVPEASAALLSELERADVLPETAMPTDVVRIGSIIEFEVDDGRCLKVQLVLPENADINAGRISVLTPVGAALIGLSLGQSMEWSGHDDKERLLTVLAVSRPQSDRGEPLGSGNLFAPTSI
jgi:regulator of nucleoside diphosphate kinase